MERLHGLSQSPASSDSRRARRHPRSRTSAPSHSLSTLVKTALSGGYRQSRLATTKIEAALALGVASLVWDVAKDLYNYYEAVRDSDSETEALRDQLLQLNTVAGHTVAALQRPGLAAEDHLAVRQALAQCANATAKLKAAVDKIGSSNSQQGGNPPKVEPIRRQGKLSSPEVDARSVGEERSDMSCFASNPHLPRHQSGLLEQGMSLWVVAVNAIRQQRSSGIGNVAHITPCLRSHVSEPAIPMILC